MRKWLLIVYLIVSVCFIQESVIAQNDDMTAFPGAEGFGKQTTGGRGGQVIFVTNLNDDTNPGSFRYAVTRSGARIIMFKISGTIQLKSVLKITNGNLTIAGQTAPGDGICLRDYPVEIQADNVIVRFLRFRLGDATQQEADAFWGREHKNIMIDHCSMSWSTDECSSFYDNENFTMQWCIVSESLRNSVHGKGAHGYGGIWGGRNASFHHNLLAHNDSRNPRFCGSRYSNHPTNELVDYRNNVIYNWRSNSAYAGEGGSYNIVNNYYKAGPATSSSSKSRILQPYADDGSNKQPAGTTGKFYIAENEVTSSLSVSNDNWLGISLHSSFNTYAPGVTKDDIKSSTIFPFQVVTTHSAEDAYENVLKYAGASLVRDTIDKRVISDAREGIAKVTDGGNGSTNGIIDTQSAVGGWPVLNSTAAPVDSDNDGMPDSWEDAKGLNKNSSADAQLKTLDSYYPNIEVYINSLVADIVENQNKNGVLMTTSELRNGPENIKIVFDHSSGELNINHENEIKSIQIYTVTGRIVRTQEVNQRHLKIQMEGYSAGVYLIRVQDKADKIFTGKMIKY